MPKVELECERCGSLYKRWPSMAEGSKYCSKSCASKQDRVKIECESCGDRFEVQKYREDSARFCSNQCRANWQSEEYKGDGAPNYKGGKREYECQSCGEGLTDWESQTGKRRFCGRECYSDWLSENNIGGEHPRWRGGPFPYGEGWNEQKKAEVRERDGHECVHCGMSQETHLDEFGRKLSVHHITPARELDDPEERNAMENLEAVCVPCHGTVERFQPLRPHIGAN